MKILAFSVTVLSACSLATFGQGFQGSFDRTLNVSGAVELDAKTDSGGITITPGSAGSVQVHAILKGNHGHMWDSRDVEQRIRALEQNPPVVQTGNTIRIGYVSDKNLLKGVSMRLEITTPIETKVRAQADSGGIRVSGVRGPVDCHTDSGGIEATDIGAEVRAAVDSGGIHVRNVRGPVVASADSGGIELTEIAGSVDAKTDSGGIRISQNAPGSIRARADSGGARIKLASNGGYDINASSGSGRITVPEMVVRGSISKHKAEGRVRGGGPLIDVHVDSGNVDIE
jgi:hypothetical protein